MYAIYDLTDYETLVGMFNSYREICKFLNKKYNPGYVSNAIRRKNKVQKKYLIERLGKE